MRPTSRHPPAASGVWSTHRAGAVSDYSHIRGLGAGALCPRFLQDNADFLDSAHLFQTELRYVLLHDTDDFGTFKDLAAQMSRSTVGDIPKQTRDELAAFAQRK